MSDVSVILITVLFIVVSIPFSYINYFIIWQLPKRFGFFKRYLIVLSVISAFILDVYLLSEGVIGFWIFILIPSIIELIGVMYFKDDIAIDIKRICNRLRDE